MKLWITLLAPLASFAAVQWRVEEIRLEAPRDFANPFEEVRLECRVAGPGAETLRVEGFHDGGRGWKARFTPTAPGVWKYDCTGGGIHSSGKVEASKASSDNALYRHGGFLRVSKGGRYLTYSDGAPFFWLGDTWWFCPSTLMPFESYRKLIDQRRRQGFTVAHWAFLGPLLSSGGSNSFQEQMAKRSLDVGYWKDVDRYVAYANEAGIVPVIGLGFHQGLDRNSLEDWQFLWRYAVARLGAYAVSWLICGEYNLERGDWEGRVKKAVALGRFIKEIDPYRRAMTVHPWYYGGEKRQAWQEPWYDFVMLQGGHPGHGKVPPARVYAEAWQTGKPVLEGECNYEGIHAGKPGKEVEAGDVRRTAYHAIQSGSFGYTYGAQGLWYPTQGPEDKTFSEWGTSLEWLASMKRPGAEQMKHLRAAYKAVEWWKLEPAALEVSGELADGVKPLAKCDGDRQCLLWFPAGSGAQTRVTLRGGGAFAGLWINPRTGDRKHLPGNLSEAPARPDEEDWLLVLRKASRAAKAYAPPHLNLLTFNDPGSLCACIWRVLGDFFW